LKENQKFGKGGGNRMSKKIIPLLQAYFHAGNVDRFERYDAAGMLSELQKLVDDKELDAETLPKVETIERWIHKYSSYCKYELANKHLQSS
jgi:hypothetical protein